MKYWHATEKRNVLNIMKEGIKADEFGYVYLCESPEDCLEFFRFRPGSDRETYAVIPLDLDESKIKESQDHNRKYINVDAFVYEGDIPPEKIPDKLTDILLFDFKK